MDYTKEAETYFEAIEAKRIEELVEAGFTEKQAAVLLKIIREIAFSGGMF